MSRLAARGIVLALLLALAGGPAAMAPRAEQGMERAAALFLDQDYAPAEALLAGVARRDPGQAPQALLLRARCLADLGRWQDCLQSLPLTPSAQGLLLKAEALQALGRGAEAGPAMAEAAEACQATPLAALASFRAGLLCAREGRAGEAEDWLKQAQRQDNSYTQVHRLLADLYSLQGRTSDAKARLERVQRTDPHDASSQLALDQLDQDNPWLAQRDLKARRQLLHESLAQPNRRALALPGMENAPPVRVGLLTHSAGFKFKLGPAMELGEPGMAGPGCGSGFLPAGSAWQLSHSEQGWSLARLDHAGRGQLRLVDLPGPLLLTPWEPGGCFRIFEVAYGSGYFFAGQEDRSYRGALELDPSPLGVTAVNCLSMEEYLAGVLPSEIPASWPAEALKAQAIVARTYALSRLGRHRKEGYDFCPEVHCEAYRGMNGEEPGTNAAVAATRGQVLVLMKSGRLVNAVYMDDCGGHTWSAEEAWGKAEGPGTGGVADMQGPAPRFPLSALGLLEWLDSQPKSWCAGGMPSSSRWVLRYAAADLDALVARRKPGLGRLARVRPLERSASGYLRRLRLEGAERADEAQGDAVRSAVRGLKSNLFYVETRLGPDGWPSEFLFHGGGWGHGVGFCQQGAAGRARFGQAAADIARAYFPGSALVQRY
jgi:SpoIID/LytB domain protein